MHDLEYVALDMSYVFPRDAGEYAVRWRLISVLQYEINILKTG